MRKVLRVNELHERVSKQIRIPPVVKPEGHLIKELYGSHTLTKLYRKGESAGLKLIG